MPQTTALPQPLSRLPQDAQRDTLMVQAAKLFYGLDRTQTEIATELGLTRWQVSRLLIEARESGVVRIDIVPPSARNTDLELALQTRFGLREAVVVVPSAGDDLARDSVAQAAAQYLAAIKPALQMIGVSWGRTMAAVAHWLPQGWANGVHVVQINGAVSLRLTPSRSHSVAEDFARKALGPATLMPVPAIVGNARTRAVLEEDRIVSDVQALADRRRTLCFSVGALSHASVHVTSGYLDTAAIDALAAKGAVGDILGRFVDADGQIVDADWMPAPSGCRCRACPAAKGPSASAMARKNTPSLPPACGQAISMF